MTDADTIYLERRTRADAEAQGAQTMTTRAQRAAWSKDLAAAHARAERATWYGDRAGAIIAAADARAIAHRLAAAALADYAERSAAR